MKAALLLIVVVSVVGIYVADAEKCKDQMQEFCKEQGKKYCDTPYGKKNCKKTCDLCDKDACPNLLSDAICEMNYQTQCRDKEFREKCKASCGCKGEAFKNDKCEDKIPRDKCIQYRNTCGTNTYMKKKCYKYCKFPRHCSDDQIEEETNTQEKEALEGGDSDYIEERMRDQDPWAFSEEDEKMENNFFDDLMHGV